MSVGVLPGSMSEPMYVAPVEVRPPGTGAIDCFYLPRGCWELNRDCLEGTAYTLTAELPLQPQAPICRGFSVTALSVFRRWDSDISYSRVSGCTFSQL